MVKFIAIIILAYLVLLLLVPKGNFLYEMLRIPAWLVRIKRFPTGNFRKSKYRYGRHFRQYLLFFQPKEAAPTRQHVVIYIHGGGWQFASPEMFKPHAQALVNEGYAVIMPSHRRLPFFNCRHFREDLVFIIKKTLEIMQLEGLADRKIILGGMSSGGNLAALLCFDRSILEAAGVSQEIFAGVFLLGAPLDLEKMWNSPPIWLLTGSRQGELFKKANPVAQLQASESIRTLIMHGTKDGLVEYQSAVSFYEKLKNCHCGEVQLVNLPNRMHMDAASWCFEKHPSRQILMQWLKEFELIGTGKIALSS